MHLFLFVFFSLVFADGHLDASKSDLHPQFLVVIVSSLERECFDSACKLLSFIFLGCTYNTVCMFVLLCIYTYVLSLIKYKCKKKSVKGS